jgi:hypothetical protein
MLIEETVYLGADNVIALELRTDYEAITHVNATTNDIVQDTHAHPTITRCKLVVNAIVGDKLDADVVIDSQTSGTWFDFSNPLLLMMKLSAATLKPGRHVTKIVIFEAGNTNGVIWGSMMLRVV